MNTDTTGGTTQKPSDQSVEAYLLAALGDHPELLRQLKELISQLPAQIRPSENLSPSTSEILPSVSTRASFHDAVHLQRGLDSNPVPGTKIGSFELVRLLGEGGMGSVWVAQQSSPVSRRVAIKLIRSYHLGSPEALMRFESERKALAIMNHPNIASILEVGSTAEGYPFFAMELVHGSTLTKFCDEQRLSIQDRLRVFLDVCKGVQHAHQKGIIHRDLKPSNILVTMSDGGAVPKVIDFGLAKAISDAQAMDMATSFTNVGQILGTFRYMSPEQAGVNPGDVDTRSDIYALGVILYELLTGTTPLDDASSKERTVVELLQLIQQQEPQRPSSKVISANGQANSRLAALRQIEITKLTRVLARDLDWIVMKALEKNPSRRYQSISDFTDDLDRYLRGDPVLARPNSIGYRVRKLVARNKIAAFTIFSVSLSLLGGALGTTWGLVRALEAEQQATDAKNQAIALSKSEKDRAESEKAAKIEAERLTGVATEALEKESRERKYAEAIASFMRDDFLALTSVKGQIRFGDIHDYPLTKDSTLRELLDRAASRLAQRQDLNPKIEAELRWIIGVNYRYLGEYKLAIGFMERAHALQEKLLGETDRTTLNTLNSLAVCHASASNNKIALALLEKAKALHKTRSDYQEQDTLQIERNIADVCVDIKSEQDVIQLYQENYDKHLKLFGEDNEDTLDAHRVLAVAHFHQGN